MTSVRYDVWGSIATLTLDNPEKRNAITEELLEQLASGIEAAEADEGVRAIVLTHTGNTFCAGADLSAQGKGSQELSPEEEQKARSRVSNGVNRLMLESGKPIVAAIHGHVRAGGMGFVASCDFVVAGPRASFGLSEVRIGVVAAIIAPPVLARLGDRVAAEWMLRGGAVSAEEAAAAGFITRAVDGEAVTVQQAVDEILADLRLAAPRALAASKRLVNRRVLDRLNRDSDEMIDLSAEFFLGDDAKAGMAAFLQKTSPPWVVEA